MDGTPIYVACFLINKVYLPFILVDCQTALRLLKCLVRYYSVAPGIQLWFAEKWGPYDIYSPNPMSNPYNEQRIDSIGKGGRRRATLQLF